MRSGYSVEHLNCNTYDNHLANLMLFPKLMNSSKGGLTKQIKSPYFCWAERYDDTAVSVQMGYCSPVEKPVYLVEGVYSITEFLERLQDFITMIKDEKALSKLKRKGENEDFEET